MPAQPLTRPFDFRSYITCAPKPGFDPVPVLDLLLLTFFLALLSSRFVFAPGTTIDLARYHAHGQGGWVSPAVLTVDRHNMAFFEGLKIPMSGLEATLHRYAEEHPQTRHLLLKADAGLDLQQLFDLMDVARSAGFDQVLVAAEEAHEPTPVQRP